MRHFSHNDVYITGMNYPRFTAIPLLYLPAYFLEFSCNGTERC